MRHFLLLIVVMTLSCASVAVAQPGGPSPDDTDGDGVPNSIDKCPTAGREYVSIEADGCPPFRAGINTVDPELKSLAKDPKDQGQAQCYFTRGDACSFTATLTLSASSAKKLKLKHRKIGDIKVDATTEKKTYGLVYGNFGWDLSSAVQKALKKALKNEDRVTLTLAGTYTRGNEKPVAFVSKTFTSEEDPRHAQANIAAKPTPDGPVDDG